MNVNIDPDWITMTLHLVGAMGVGGVIGLERSYHGRPAGFRTHTLVCLASSLLTSPVTGITACSDTGSVTSSPHPGWWWAATRLERQVA